MTSRWRCCSILQEQERLDEGGIGFSFERGGPWSSLGGTSTVTPTVTVRKCAKTCGGVEALRVLDMGQMNGGGQERLIWQTADGGNNHLSSSAPRRFFFLVFFLISSLLLFLSARLAFGVLTRSGAVFLHSWSRLPLSGLSSLTL